VYFYVFFFCNRKRKEVLSKPAGNISASAAWLRRVYFRNRSAKTRLFFWVSVQANLPRRGCHLRTRVALGAPCDQQWREHSGRWPRLQIAANGVNLWPGIPPTVFATCGLVRTSLIKGSLPKWPLWLVHNLTHTRHARHPPPQLWLSHKRHFGGLWHQYISHFWTTDRSRGHTWIRKWTDTGCDFCCYTQIASPTLATRGKGILSSG